MVSQWRPVWFLLWRMNVVRQGGEILFRGRKAISHPPWTISCTVRKVWYLYYYFPFLFESCQPQSLIFLQSFFYYYLSIFIRCLSLDFSVFRIQMLHVVFNASSENYFTLSGFFFIDLFSSFLPVMSTLTLEGWKPVTNTYTSIYYCKHRVKC